MLKIILVSSFVLLNHFFVFSQTGNYEPKLMLATPEASQLGKYGDISVNLFTGQPGIEVPLFQANLTSNFSLPVKLTYGANGFNPNAEASNVGLGWNLQYGGLIVRSVRNMDDLSNSGMKGYANIPRSPEDWWWNHEIPNLPTPDYEEYISGHVDQEADIFVANFLGRTLKFILKIKVLNNGQIGCELLEKSDLKIKCIPNTGLGVLRDAVGFEITDENGIKYVFKTTEYSTTRSLSQSCTANTNGTGGNCSLIGSGSLLNPSGPNESNTAMAWYLDTVITANNERINFEYDYYGNGKIYNSQSQVIYSESKVTVSLAAPVFNPGSAGNIQVPIRQSFSETGFLHAYIKKISSINGSVNFETSDRTDIDQANANYNNYFPPGQKLSPQKINRITFKNSNDKIIKTIQFNQTYYNSGLTPASLYQRLKLNSVDFLDETGAVINSYAFQYIEPGGSLPPKNTTDIDHWGYFNDKGNSTKQLKLIPTHMTSYVGSFVPNLYLLPGANRETDESSTKLTMLSKIIYPTGGESNFDWEQNTYSTKKSEQAIIDQNGGSYYSNNTITAINSGCSYLINDFPGSYIDQTFTLSGSTTIPFNSVLQCIPSHGSCTYLTAYGNSPYIQILDASNNFLILQRNCNEYQLNNLQMVQHTDAINLDAGTYIVRIYKLFGGFCGSCSYTYYNPPILTNPDDLLIKNAGGLRVKSIISKDNVGAPDIVKTYKYTTTENNQIVSSGKLVPVPTYTSLVFRSGSGSVPVYGGPVGKDLFFQFVTGSPKITIESSAQGNYLGYGVVDEEVSNGANKYILRHKFRNFDGNVLPNDRVPGLPNYTWQNVTGSLTDQDSYDKNNAIVKHVNNEYHTSNPEIAFLVNQSIQSENLMEPLSILSPYRIFKTRNDVKKTTELIYASGGTTLTTQADLLYGSDIGSNHNLLVKKSYINSKGETIEQNLKYPPDFAGTPIYDEMTNRNMINPSIEQVQINTTLNNKELSRVRNDFQFWDNNLLIVPSTIKSSSSGNALETEITFNDYDTKGNALMFTPKGGIKKSFIWDYNTQYPIAEVLNANSSEIAYTSFELDGKGNWLFSGATLQDATAISGKKVYDPLNGQLTRTTATAGDYIVSYWSKNGQRNVNGTTATAGYSKNSWVYYEHKVTLVANGTVIVSGSGVIDELRLYPVNAKMTTYTYEPLIGVTSQCDPNNQITYYEYDGFNRLALIKDQDKNILKRFCYNYAGKPENCN